MVWTVRITKQKLDVETKQWVYKMQKFLTLNPIILIEIGY